MRIRMRISVKQRAGLKPHARLADVTVVGDPRGSLLMNWTGLDGRMFVLFVCLLLLFYGLATSKDISGWVPTCDSAHSW